MITYKPTDIKDLVCHQMQIGAQAALKDFSRRYPAFASVSDNAELIFDTYDQQYLGNVAEQLVAYLYSWVLTSSHPQHEYMTFEYKVPATWFDHLKQSIKYGKRPRWVRQRVWAWFVGKLEVKLTLKTITKDYVKNINVCPHANEQFPDRNHILFMLGEFHEPYSVS